MFLQSVFPWDFLHFWKGSYGPRTSDSVKWLWWIFSCGDFFEGRIALCWGL